LRIYAFSANLEPERLEKEEAGDGTLGSAQRCTHSGERLVAMAFAVVRGLSLLRLSHALVFFLFMIISESYNSAVAGWLTCRKSREWSES
jgi:hypothetical protein